MDRKEMTKKILIEIPSWIYYGGGQVKLTYRTPEGEWAESVFYPIDSIALFDEKKVLSSTTENGGTK